ncbi:MAG: NADH-quinone oxidoreductase subunit J [Candidatus Omnitrophota bacterium]
MVSALFFWIFALAACLFGAGVIVARNPMHSALSLAAVFVCAAGIFLQLHAEFLAWILIIVYTGAVMTLMIFVISLLNLQSDKPISLSASRRWGIALIVLFVFAFLIYLFRADAAGFFIGAKPPVPDEWGSAQEIASHLFTRYLLPFELASILLTAAVAGAIALAMKPDLNEEEKAE